ncbi:MAG: PEGA domain-containing protein [Polyangiaceae bacterium]
MRTQGRSLFSKTLAMALVVATTLPALPVYAQTSPAPAKTETTKKATAAATTPATAKPNLNEAKKRYAAGEKKFKAADYPGALDDFNAADAIKSTPQSARYIGLTNDKLGKFADAIPAYDRFLADVPAKMTKEADETRARETEIKAMPGKLHIDATPAGAQVTVAGKQAMPIPADLELAPGKYQLHVSADGYTAQDRDVDVQLASTQAMKIDLEPAAAPPPPPPVAAVAVPPPAPPPAAPLPPEPRSKLPAYVTGGLAVVAAGVGTVFGVLALGDKSDFDKNPSSSKADDGENHALIADMAFGVAVTFGVTSAVLFLTKDDQLQPPAAKAATPHKLADRKPQNFKILPAPILTPHSAGAGALIRF